MDLSIIAPFCWRHWLVHAMRVSNYKLFIHIPHCLQSREIP